MFATIRGRVIFIVVLVAASAFSLRPRTIAFRSGGGDSSVQEEEVRRWGIKTGLDLQGGMHLGLEIDQSQGAVADVEDAIDRALTVIRSRVDEFGVGEPLIQKVGTDRIVVELPGIDDPERARNLIERSAFLEFRITDMQNEFMNVIPQIDDALRREGITGSGAGDVTASAIEQLLASTDSTDQTQADSAVADTTTIGDLSTAPGAFSSLLFNGQLPGEFLVPEEEFPRADSLINLPVVQRLIPRGKELRWGREPLAQGARSFRPLYVVDSRPIITGDQLSDANATLDQMFNTAVVDFQLTRSGGRVFGRETARHVGDYMAIMLDGRVQGRPPVIRSQIRRRGQIELGNASLQEAQDLALVLRAGALPAPIVIVEERTVGPSLGQDSIEKGITAGIIGMILVIGVMIFYYRTAGLLAVAGLGFYVIFTLGGLSGFDATLTLPGLAGFVLSLGIAVDANVLIFERIREELELNKTPKLAVDTGFQRAMPAIVDSNITTIITALFLFQFGTGPVKGFAVTLTVGIIASLVTAVFVTRTFFMIWLNNRSATKELAI
jgi:preprotein translocase subunit SecD